MGCCMGRPREYDREEYAIKLKEWSLLDDSTNLNGFCAEYSLLPRHVSQWAKENENFREAYELAKARIANRREKKLSKGELHVKAYDLNARVYDQFLDEKQKDIANENKESEGEVLKGLHDLAKELKKPS